MPVLWGLDGLLKGSGRCLKGVVLLFSGVWAGCFEGVGVFKAFQGLIPIQAVNQFE